MCSYLGGKVNSIQQLIDASEAHYPRLAALQLSPHAYVNCPQNMNEFIHANKQMLYNKLSNNNIDHIDSKNR